MAVDDVAKAVLGLIDEDVRARVADGDRAALGELDLTADEQTIVDDLIEQLTGDEVSGFSMGRSAGFAAVSYVNTAKPSDPTVSAQWNQAQTAISTKGNPGGQATMCLCDGTPGTCQKPMCAKSQL